jgi:hypothetical protein
MLDYGLLEPLVRGAGLVVLGAGLVVLGFESSTSPPEVLVVPRCAFALLDGTHVVPVLVVDVVLAVTPVPFAPFVVLRPVNRWSGFVAAVPAAVVPVVLLLVLLAVVLVPVVLTAGADIEVVAVGDVVVAPVVGVVAPKVAVVPVPESVRPVAPVVLAMPGAGEASGEPLITMPGGHGCALLVVVCWAPAVAASATPMASAPPTARHRISRGVPAIEVDIVPSVSLPWRPRGH